MVSAFYPDNPSLMKAVLRISLLPVLMQHPELHRCHLRHLLKHGSKVAGILESHLMRNSLNFHPLLADQQLLRLGNPERCHIFIDRTAQKSSKQPG